MRDINVTGNSRSFERGFAERGIDRRRSLIAIFFGGRSVSGSMMPATRYTGSGAPRAVRRVLLGDTGQDWVTARRKANTRSICATGSTWP